MPLHATAALFGARRYSDGYSDGYSDDWESSVQRALSNASTLNARRAAPESLRDQPSLREQVSAEQIEHEHKSEVKRVTERVTRALLTSNSQSSLQEGDVSLGQRVLSSFVFNAIIQTAVVLNVVQLGLQVDFVAGLWKEIWQVSDHCFTSIFAVEMVVKIAVLRRKYFLVSWMSDAGISMRLNLWNMLDFVVAWATIVDTWILPSTIGETGSEYFLALELLRLLRVTKLYKASGDLVVLIGGIASSMRSMMWIAILLCSVLYAAGIFFAQTVGGENFEGTYSSMDFDTYRYFGSLWRAMMTLFSICLLDQWTELIMPIYEVQPYLVPFFVIFLVLTSFGLLNAIIGILVDKTTDAMAQVRQLDDKMARQLKVKKVEQLADMVGALDTSRDGVISMAEMEAAEKNADFQQVLGEIDLPSGFTATDLYHMLDPTGHGEISQDDFIRGMYRLIFCNDFQRECLMTNSIAQVKREVFDQGKTVEQQLKLIRQDIAALRGLNVSEAPTQASKPLHTVTQVPSAVSAVVQLPSEPKPCDGSQEFKEEKEGKEHKESKYNRAEVSARDRVVTQHVQECTSKVEAAVEILKDSIRTMVSWHEDSLRFHIILPDRMGDGAGVRNNWLGESPSPQLHASEVVRRFHDLRSRLPSPPSLELPSANAARTRRCSHAGQTQRSSRSDFSAIGIPKEVHMASPHAMSFERRT